jgi:hypothetical protein
LAQSFREMNLKVPKFFSSKEKIRTFLGSEFFNNTEMANMREIDHLQKPLHTHPVILQALRRKNLKNLLSVNIIQNHDIFKMIKEIK